MKRIFKILLCLALLLQAPSCIVPVTETPTGTATTEQTAPSTNTPAPPSFVPWSDAGEVAHRFLSTPNAVVDCSEKEYSYFEMEEDLKALAASHPTRFSYRSFGKSVAGRELYVATLGNPNAENQILISAGIHGREYLTPLLVMKQAEFYLTYYDEGNTNGFTFASLFDRYCFYLVPMSNPDGIMLSQEGLKSIPNAALSSAIQAAYFADRDNGLTKAKSVNEYLTEWKANANAVDLNRNFDAFWSSVNTGMPRPSHKNYKGESAASEPETRALSHLVESLPKLRAVLCIHSQGEVLYWDCGQDKYNEELYDATRAFTETVARRTGYVMINEPHSDACFADWCALKQDLIAITVETGLGTCPLPIDQMKQIWEDTYDLFTVSAIHLEMSEGF